MVREKFEKKMTGRSLKEFYRDEKKFAWGFQTLKGYYEPFDTRRMEAIISALNDIQPVDAYALDIGCGAGLITKELSKKFRHTVGIDISETLLKQVDKNNFFLTIAGDCQSEPFKSESFDFIVCSEVIEHIMNAQAALSEITRILKKNGRAIITVPNLYGYDSLEGKYHIVTNIIGLINKVRRIFGLNQIYEFGYNLHIHKYSPKKWQKIIESCGLKVTSCWPVYIFPYIPDVFAPLKKIELALFNNALIFWLQRCIENKLAKVWPFRRLGQSHLFLAEK